jgi:hypothetical protein
LDAARVEHDRLKRRAQELQATADRARVSAERARSEADETRREAERDASAIRAEAVGMLERVRSGDDSVDPSARRPRPVPAELATDDDADGDDATTGDTATPLADDEPGSQGSGRRSRYARQSAQLPRIGDQAGDVLSEIADMRKRRSRKDGEED